MSDVADKILKEVSYDLYEYCPGNCTRYYIFAKEIVPSADDSADLAFMWLVRGDRGGQGMILPRDCSIELDYFQKKTGIKNKPDAVALLCFLAERFGVKPRDIPVVYKIERWFLDVAKRVGADVNEWCR
jgi:hypothetical protein